MRNKVLGALALIAVVGFIFFMLNRNTNQSPVVDGPEAEQRAKDLQTVRDEKATEVETYEALHRMAHAQDEAALTAALEKINSPSRITREAAANALGYFKSDRAFEGLQKLLKDEDENVRIRTLQALKNAFEPRRLKLVNDHIGSNQLTAREKTIGYSVLIQMSPDDEGKKLAIDFLADIVKSGDALENHIALSNLIEAAPKDQRVIEVVREKIQSSRDGKIIADGIRHLASIKDPWLGSKLSPYLSSKSPEVRSAAETAKQILDPR